jgi:hypothetical protein
MVEICKVCGVPVQLGRHNEEIEYVEREGEGDLPMASLMLGGGWLVHECEIEPPRSP